MKLEVRNNWGSLSYNIGEDEIREDGAIVYVTFPNGERVPKGIQFERHYAHVSDHGHDCSIWTRVAYINVDVMGRTECIKFFRTEDAADLNFELVSS